MALPKEPRQKMINIMYLVLTALLALNVSSEILNAFKTVNNSLVASNIATNASTTQILESLTDKLEDAGTKAKAEIWLPKAKEVIAHAKTANDLIQQFKDEILKESGGDPGNPEKKFKEDNLDIPTRLMIKQGKGKQLLQALIDFKTKAGGIGGDSAKAEITKMIQINTDKPITATSAKKSWEEVYFHMVPSVAALTILSKFQNDIKTTENRLVTFCHEQVGKVKYRQDAFTALAVANSTNVLPNQEIEVTAGVGGFSKSVVPSISINGAGVPLGEDGAAHYKFTAGAVGTHTIPVNITYTDQDGNKQSVQKTIEYTVGQSNAAVQLDKLNVLFIGVDNPFTISGSGDVQRLTVVASGGGATISGTGASRTIRVNQETDECYITVTTPDGKKTPVKFRVRSIPDPTPIVGGADPNSMRASEFVAQPGVRAFVPNFFYETQFTVTSFHIVGDGEGFGEGAEEAYNTGATWNEARKIIQKIRPGSFITIDEIRAVGPDGRSRKLRVALSYSLK